MEETKVNAYDWPCYEDGKPVRIGDVLEFESGYLCVAAIEFYYDHEKNRMCAAIKDGKESFWSNRIIVTPDNRLKRPVVRAADDKPLVEGEIVYSVATGEPYSIDRIMMKEDGNFFVKLDTSDLSTRWRAPDELTHEKPVFDADGLQIHVGDTVYNNLSGAEYTVLTKLDKTGWINVQDKARGYDIEIYGNCVTHVKPDSFERIKEDLDKPSCEYFGFSEKLCSDGCPAFDIEGHCTDIQNADIVSRLKAILEKGE